MLAGSSLLPFQFTTFVPQHAKLVKSSLSPSSLVIFWSSNCLAFTDCARSNLAWLLWLPSSVFVLPSACLFPCFKDLFVAIHGWSMSHDLCRHQLMWIVFVLGAISTDWAHSCSGLSSVCQWSTRYAHSQCLSRPSVSRQQPIHQRPCAWEPLGGSVLLTNLGARLELHYTLNQSRNQLDL